MIYQTPSLDYGRMTECRILDRVVYFLLGVCIEHLCKVYIDVVVIPLSYYPFVSYAYMCG